MEVSFEPSVTLTFCTNREAPSFSLCADRWNGDTGHLRYGGRDFTALPGSNNAYLLVDIKQLAKVKKKSRTVQGRKLQSTYRF
jgi:hypothetical protein